jgi:hypothetical protein
MYKPFHAETNRNPEILTAAEEVGIPPAPPPDREPADGPADSPGGEVILERNGIHYINNRMLNPDKDTEKTLNPKFLNLVESVIKPVSPGSP